MCGLGVPNARNCRTIGCVMSDSAGSSPFATLSLDPVSTVDRVAEELRRSLFEGELGPGTALREVALADALGVSRSTVREALGMLVAEGLADRVPNKGTQVRRLDPDQVRDVCQARMVIETAGVRRWNEADETLRSDVRRALEAFSRPDPRRRLHRCRVHGGPPRHPPRPLRADGIGAAGRRGRVAARRGAARARARRPGPRQRHRAGALARRPARPCWRRTTSRQPPTSSPNTSVAPRSRCSRRSGSATPDPRATTLTP